jgi:hypothetical protein
VPSYYRFDPEAKVDALCLEQAWRFIECCFDSTLRGCAENSGVPVYVLEDFVCDRIIFRHAGVPPCPVEWYVDYANEAKRADEAECDYYRDRFNEVVEQFLARRRR